MTLLDPRPAKPISTPIGWPPDASTSRSAAPVATSNLRSPSGQASPGAIRYAEPITAPPRGMTGGPTSTDTRDWRAAGSDVPDPSALVPPIPPSLSLLDPALCLAADVLDDIERVRIANQNRLRQLTRTEADSDGEERGFGLDGDHPDVMRLGLMVHTLEQVEHDATLNLQRKMRKHPLGAWMKAQRGIGEKQGARLLAAIGDPYINSAKGTPRTVSALWAYCGLHVLPVDGQVRSEAHGPTAIDGSQLPASQSRNDDHLRTAGGDQHRDPGQTSSGDQRNVAGVAARRRKGERANWSTKAKMRAYLIAESCIKQLSSDCRDGHTATDSGSAAPVLAGEQGTGQLGAVAQAVRACLCSPYRVVYDDRRARTAITHPDWPDGHSHNDALRVASKAILRDLWRAAREWHLKDAA